MDHGIDRLAEAESLIAFNLGIEDFMKSLIDTIL